MSPSSVTSFVLRLIDSGADEARDKDKVLLLLHPARRGPAAARTPETQAPDASPSTPRFSSWAVQEWPEPAMPELVRALPA
jgi:hypothetical protein